jgi:hypothetical protein
MGNDETPNEELVADLDNKILKAINDSDCGIFETIMKILPNHFIFLGIKTTEAKANGMVGMELVGRKTTHHYARQLCMKSRNIGTAF